MNEVSKIEMLAVSALTPYERNARKHGDEDVGAIAESIREFGFNDPIGIWGKDNTIVEGHGRLMAAKSLGMDKVTCIRLDHLTDEQRRAYAIAHNRTAELSTWDDDLLKIELGEIQDIDMGAFDFDVQIDDPVEAVDDDYEQPEAVEPRTKLGDVFQLGDHRLMCGDSTKAADVQALMGGALADMVFTDPPWNVDYGQENERWKQRSILNDSMSTEDFKQFMNGAFACMNEASKKGAMTYVVMSAQEWGNLMLTLASNGYHWSSSIIWNKDTLVLSRKDYHTKYEPIWYGWKDGEARLCPLKDRKQSDVWDFDRPKRSDEHPTMKPVPLVMKAITNSSKPSDIVLDLFGGSGTTLIAAEETGRKCYMMELDPHYCDVIIDRWEQFTGRKAVKL